LARAALGLRHPFIGAIQPLRKLAGPDADWELDLDDEAYRAYRERRVVLVWVTERIEFDGPQRGRFSVQGFGMPFMRWFAIGLTFLQAETKESLERAVEALAAALKSPLFGQLGAVAALIVASRLAFLMAQLAAIGTSLRELIGELTSPHVLAAGSGPGTFIPRC
jgi:hypothetical protein